MTDLRTINVERFDVEATTSGDGMVRVMLTTHDDEVYQFFVNNKQTLNWLRTALKQAKDLAFN